MAALHFFHFMVSLCLPFFFCVTFFILRDLVSNFLAGAVVLPGTAVVPGEDGAVADGTAEAAGDGTVVGIAGIEFSGGDSKIPGTAELAGEGLTTGTVGEGVVVGAEVPEAVSVAVGVAELVGKGVFVGTGFSEGSIVADGDADICTSFFKSSMICCSEFFRFRRGVI